LEDSSIQSLEAKADVNLNFFLIQYTHTGGLNIPLLAALGLSTLSPEQISVLSPALSQLGKGEQQ